MTFYIYAQNAPGRGNRHIGCVAMYTTISIGEHCYGIDSISPLEVVRQGTWSRNNEPAGAGDRDTRCTSPRHGTLSTEAYVRVGKQAQEAVTASVKIADEC